MQTTVMNGLKIAIVGVGALGSELCMLLAQQACSHVLLVDPDRLEKRNVRNSSVYREIISSKSSKSFEAFKVDLLKDWAASFHGLSWRALACEIADVGLVRLAELDVIVSCTDSALARCETTLVAKTLGIPMIDGGVMSEGIHAGRVAWFPAHRQTACYLCGISDTRRAEIFQYAMSSSLGCGAVEANAPMTGTTETLQRTAATMREVLNAWANDEQSIESVAYRLQLNPNNQQWSRESIVLTRSATCPWHEELHASPLPYDRSIRTALGEGGLRLHLQWPQCLTARCVRCGHRSEPYRRVAWVRRKMMCDQCRSIGTCDPLKVIESIGEADRAATLSPRQLGMPNEHLYLFRRTFVLVAGKDVDESVA
jgi:hypothetical protein